MGTTLDRGTGREDGHVTPTPDPAPGSATPIGAAASIWDAPSGPPADRSSAARRSGRAADDDEGQTPVQDQDTGFTWPFASFGEAAEWWYRPVIEARSWVAFASLFVGAVWGPVMFAGALAASAIVFGLCFVGVGLLLIAPLFGLIAGLSAIERRRAGWVGEPIVGRELLHTSSDNELGGSGYWAGTTARLADANRWRQVAFIASSSVVGPVLFAVGALAWTIVAQLVFGGFGDIGAALVRLVLAGVVVGAAPRVTIAVSGVAHSYVAWFLGPDENAELAERVEELAAQRQQILDAVDDERRRIERNLHDGVQQQLVALGIDVARARARIDDDPAGARMLLDDARDKVRASIGELRLIGRGLHPAVLDDRGLDAALSAVVADSPIPISVNVSTVERLPDDLATTAYYVASEAVANILKHSAARVASVRVEDGPGPTPAIRITIHDDGRGGADVSKGSGLAGMRARIEGVDGTFRLSSPAGGPTTIVAVLPVPADTRTNDAGTIDTGTIDTGTNDAGKNDAGTIDAGTIDAGTIDG
jgi:signal transduction histidine kinase